MNKKNAPISHSEIYVLRIFHWEQNEYASMVYFNFGEAWTEFYNTVDDMKATFTGGMITPDGHYYLAQTEEYCIQLCPFITDLHEDAETEDM